MLQSMDIGYYLNSYEGDFVNSVERVKQLCKEKGIPISRLEKELGYANGYISQLRKGIFPSDRLKEISDYLEVSIGYLMTGEERENCYINEEIRKMAQDIFERKELRMLFATACDAKTEDLQTVHNMLLALKQKEHEYTDEGR